HLCIASRRDDDGKPLASSNQGASIDHIMALSERRISLRESRSVFGHRQALPRQGGFVHTQALDLEQSGVSYHIAPRPEQEDSARDNFSCPHHMCLPVAWDGC